MAVFERAALNILDFTQAATSNIKWKHIRHRLKMSAGVDASPKVESVAQRLWFQHVAKVDKAIYHVTAGNVLVFHHVAISKALQEFIHQYMILVGEVTVKPAKGGVSGLALSQSVSVEVVKNNPIDTFTLTQEATFLLERGTDIAHTLALHQGVSVYKPSKNFIVS